VCLSFASVGGAEQGQAQLGTPERRVARADHSRGHREQGQTEAAARSRRGQETSHPGNYQ